MVNVALTILNIKKQFLKDKMVWDTSQVGNRTGFQIVQLFDVWTF
jgi:hypothetical protein